MKKLKNIVFLCMSLAVTLSACTDDFDDPTIERLNPVYEGAPVNTTIAELKTQFDAAIFANPDTRTQITDDIIIEGVVTANDRSGNFYKGIYIQDSTAAIKISVDATHLCAAFHIGQRVVVNCKDLYIGGYRNHAQLGADYNGTVGRMSLTEFNQHVTRDAFSSPGNLPKPIEVYSSDPDSIDKMMDGMLVTLVDAIFPTAGYSYFADAVSGEAGTSNTTILMESDYSTITKRTSNYGSGIANQIIPEGTGRVTGIFSRYVNSWQITIRDINDLEGFTFPEEIKPAGSGTKEDPYSVIGSMGKSGEGWVKGYIVGAIDGMTITEGADFEAPFDAYSNLLLAASPDETSFYKCIAVQLPTGEIRDNLSLKDNPAMLGQEVLLYGSFDAYFGVSGLKDTGCAYVGDTKYGVDISNAVFYEPFAASQGEFSIVDILKPETLSYVWAFKDRYGMVASGYLSGTNNAVNSWLISPAIDLSAKTTAKLTFQNAANYFASGKVPEEVAVWVTTSYTDGAAIDETQWTKLEFTYPAGNSWNFMSSGDINLDAFAGQSNVRIAFQYKSTATKAGTWEVAKVLID